MITTRAAVRRRLLPVPLVAGLLAAYAVLAPPAPVAAAPAVNPVCTSKVPHDVNGDGYADVAVSSFAPSSINIVYGQPTGLVTEPTATAPDDQYLTVQTPELPIRYRGPYSRVGPESVFGDFNHDGCADLVVQLEDAEEDEDEAEDGRVYSIFVVYGSRAGLVLSSAQLITSRPVPSGYDDIELDTPVVVGDLDGDGVDDLATGGRYSKGEDVRDGVFVFYGDAAGLDRGAAAAEAVRPTSRFTGGNGRSSEYYPETLTIGDFNGDGADELAIDNGEQTLETIQRGADGFAGQPRRYQTYAELGLTGTVRGDTILAAGDLNDDGRDDLVLGSTYWRCAGCSKKSERGVVFVLPGSKAGITGRGRQRWTQASKGVVGSPDVSFGSALAVARLDDDGYADLVIGDPLGRVGSQAAAGSVTLLRGGQSGASTKGYGGVRLTQATAGIAGTARKGDNFGGAVAVAYVQGRNQANVIIGAPGETRDGVASVGQILQLAAAPNGSGPMARGSVTLHLDSPGLQGQPVRGSSFGVALG